MKGYLSATMLWSWNEVIADTAIIEHCITIREHDLRRYRGEIWLTGNLRYNIHAD
jgi:hypothetical protein